ncbi:aldehyde dehydrogenase family protein [Alteribacillus sp. HJP-4]|uniref:aldehyde dehydrogenase family protein n=1 Tax=Alteribacillus sp. HJP-4 TaxID=2775394 RepID=UPI0035CCED0E
MTPEAIAPAYGTKINSFEETHQTEVPDIYERSRTAFSEWSKLSLKQRLSYLQKMREVIVDLQEEIADIVSLSTGKTKTDALTAEVLAAADAIKHVEKEAPNVLAKEKVKTPVHFMGKTSYIDRKPRGTVLVVSPWNFPFQLAFTPVAEALAAGNTVILKPSEITPVVGLLIKRIMNILPENVVQTVIGGKALGEALTKGRPDYIHFTGSVETGKEIQQQAAKQLIPTTLELGGKDAMLVFDDANVKRAAKAAVWGAFNNSGQICLSVERVYVQEGIYDEFLAEIKYETAKLRQGTHIDADIGSMTTQAQVNVVKKHVQDALDKNAVLESGKVPDEWKSNDPFIEPVILTNVDHGMLVMNEETFGPIMPVATFATEEEAVQLSNNTSYGLGGSVFTSDISKAERITSHLITGNVTINDVLINAANYNLPYGGVNYGGIGKYHGREGIKSFSIETSVMVDKGTSVKEIMWFPYAGKYDIFKELIGNYWGSQRNWKAFIQSYMRLLKK